MRSKKIIFLTILMVVLFGNSVDAKSFLDSLETRTQLPCDIWEYQQLNRQKLSIKVVSKHLPQVFDAQKQAEYYSLGKIVTKDYVLLLIEQKYEYDREGYICKIDGKGKGAFVSEMIHIVDNFRKVFIIDGRKIIVSRVDTINPDRDYLSYELATEYYNLPDSYPTDEVKECTGLPKNIQELKEVEWGELSIQYVKDSLFQVQNRVEHNYCYTYEYSSYKLPNEVWQMIMKGFYIESYFYLCYRKGNDRYPRMLAISSISGGSIDQQFFIVGSKIYILDVFDYDDDVCQRVEIYDLRDGEMNRLYSSY